MRLPFALLTRLQRPFVRAALHHPRRIVVIKPCCLGDLIMTTPLLAVLHQQYPDALISYVAGTWSKVVPEHHPAVDDVLDCGSVGIPGRYSLREYWQLVMKIRRYHFDLALVLDRSPMLTLLPFLAGIPRRVGPDSLGRGFSLTDRVPVSSDLDHLQHEVDIYLDLARAIKLPIAHPHMSFVPTVQEQQAIYQGDRPLVAVFPGGGSNPGMELTSKRWSLERYRTLVQRLVQEFGVQVLLIGGKDDVALNEQLIAGLDTPEQREHVLNIADMTSFGELAAQLAACTLFIGNDSSPMHLAAAVDIPVIAIFGPTSPQEYGPYPTDDPKHISLWHHPSGQPCFFLGQVRACAHCTCMQSVSVDEVWQAVLRLIPTTQSSEARS